MEEKECKTPDRLGNTARYLTDPTATHLMFEVRQAFQLNFDFSSAFNRCAL